MKFRFKFLLANGGTEVLAFTAADFRTAHSAAVGYSRAAFADSELIDFYYAP